MKYLSITNVVAKTTISQSSIRRMVKAGRFPEPRPIMGGYRSVFLESEVDAWMASEIDGSANSRSDRPSGRKH